MGDDPMSAGTVIELRLPPSLRFSSVVRVVAASLAADENISVTRLAEFRTAVDDAFEAVVQETVPVDRYDGDTALAARFSVSPGRVLVEFSLTSVEQPWAVASQQGASSDVLLVIEDGEVVLSKGLPRQTVSPHSADISH